MQPVRFLFAIFCVLSCSLGLAQAASLAEIKARGILIVGAKADYPPYGFQAQNGEIAGIEPDLAADLAKQLGVSLKIVPVLTSNRIEMLNNGSIDIVIATLSITGERRKEAAIIDPPYYAAGAGLLVQHGIKIEEVSDLEKRTICAVEGNIFWTQIQSNSRNFNAIVFKDTNLATQALIDHKCEVLVSNDNHLAYKKQSEPERFREYSLLSLTDIDPLLWGVALKRGEENSALAKAVSQAVTGWHRSGFLLNVEKQWLGSNTPLAKALNRKWTVSSSLQ